jgi:hypothetical protein
LGTNSSLIECKVSRTALGITGSAQLIFNGILTDNNAPAVDNWPYKGANKYYSGNLGTNIPTDQTLWLP